MADDSPSQDWERTTDYQNMPRVKTGIPFTPRILAAMLQGGNAMGINWAAKFAKIPETDVPENALKPVIHTSFEALGADNLLSALLPADILGDLTETQSVDDVRDGEWIPEVLEVVTGRFCANEGEEIEHVYQNCDRLMTGADVLTFYWDANFVIHVMAMDRIDDNVFHDTVSYYRRFADEDPVGSLFALFMLAFLGPRHFNTVIKSLA